MRIEQTRPNRWVARSSYSEKDVVKAAGFRWDRDARQWWTSDPAVAAKLADPEQAARCVAEAATRQAVRQEAIETSRAQDADVELPCSAGLPCPAGLAYLPYQRAGIAAALKRQNVLFGDEMGLGKTIQAIGLINADPTLNRILVICPATLRVNWRNELRKWLTRDLTIGFATGSICDPKAFNITIINYDILTRHESVLRSITWDLIIADEAHFLKNPKAKRTRAVVGIDDYTAKKEDRQPLAPIAARRAALLTGTPIPNRPVEAWPLVHFLAPTEFRSFYGYATRYCAAGNNGYGWDASGSSNLAELQDKLRATIMIRRLKADVLTELPAKRRAIIELPANGASGAVDAEVEAYSRHEEQLDALRVAVELAKASDRQEDYEAAVGALKVTAQAAFAEMSKLRHETAVAKIPYVIDHIRSIVEAGSKVVVFAHHHDVIEALAAEFGSQAVTLYGETKMADRQAAVDRFQSDSNVLVFIGGILAAGVGITLTAASHVVFAELDWVPGNMTQAEDRLHRIGQRDMVLVQHLVLEGSLDARMAHILVEKQEVQAQALDRVTVEVEVPAVPSRQRATTESASRERIAREAEMMTPEQIGTVAACLILLAALDADHASVVNGVGFSKIDNQIGHSLAAAASAGRMSPKQAALGARLVHKYRRQLEG